MARIRSFGLGAPIQSWVCDTCHQLIRSAEAGVLEWRADKASDEKQMGCGLRIVHLADNSPRTKGCQYKQKDVLGDINLPELMGPDGLVRLLEMFVLGYHQTSEIIDIIQRLFVPRYEEARRHFAEAVSNNVIELRSTMGFFSQRELRAILKMISRESPTS